MKARNLILIIEDCEEDVELLRIAIRRAELPEPIEVVRDGQAAIEYLCGNGPYGDRQRYPFPGMIFLDLKLPKLNGFDVLQWLKTHEECKVVPAIILTSSSIERDVMKAYQLGANCYLVKPNRLDELVRMVDLAFRFWAMCALPHVPEKC